MPTKKRTAARKTATSGRTARVAKRGGPKGGSAAAAEKLDLHKLHRAEYAAPKRPVILEVGSARYLAIEGQGSPEDAGFQAGIGAMFGMAYTLKFTSKFAGRDYKVCTLEALWSGPDGELEFHLTPREAWRWTFLIRTPDFITDEHLATAAATLIAKGKPAHDVRRVRLETLAEGRCVQMLHVGPYGEEGRTVQQMLELAQAHGLEPHGRHHEIYLSDPRRVPPERLKTILRLPVRVRTT